MAERRPRWSRVFERDARAEVEDELAFHLEQRARDHMARGLDAESARKLAEERLGDLGSVRRECTQLLRAERRARARSYFMKMSLLDFRLGFRMLVKYPGLTIVGGLAMALAIAVGAFAFEFSAQVMNPKLPLPESDRIVALRLWHRPTSSVEEQALFDFAGWRGTLRSLDELGAYRDVDRNLVTPTGQALPMRVAEVTASAFRIAQVKPLLGRTLEDADEAPGAPSVLVIGERIWRSHFRADPGVLGRTVRLGNVHSTIVGVLPETYGFPVHHAGWTQLRFAALTTQPREGSPISMFGRLAAGASVGDAQAELTLRGERTAAEQPRTHEHIRPEVMPYARSFFPVSWRVVAASAFAGQTGVLLFLVLVCANVATLVFARTATRESEMVVRSALGASRARIVTQVMTETLVLGAVAALVGLAVARAAIRITIAFTQESVTRLPFWISDGLSPITVFYTALLTVLAALIAGAVPALKVTRGLADRLRQASVAAAELKFGRLWTGLIVTQVALTVIFMAVTVDAQQDRARARAMQLGFPAHEYLSAQLEFDRDAAATENAELRYTLKEHAHFRATLAAIQQRLSADPAVGGIAYAMSFPGQYHERNRIEVDGPAAPAPSGFGHMVQHARVGVGYFTALRAKLIAGRDFNSADVTDARNLPTGADVFSENVIVNESFVRQVFGGGDVIGRRFRYVCRAGRCGENPNVVQTNHDAPWHVIVGVVKDIAMTGDPDLLDTGMGGVYHAWQPGDVYWTRIALQVRGDARAYAPQFRAHMIAVDPGVRLRDVMTLDDLYASTLKPYDLGFRALLIASAVVLLLSVAGTYSILAFTVARRTREIGIRTALGANPRRIVLAIFSRALTQVLVGVAVGAVAMLVAMRGIQSPRGLLISCCPSSSCWPYAPSPARSRHGVHCACSQPMRCAPRRSSTFAQARRTMRLRASPALRPHQPQEKLSA